MELFINSAMAMVEKNKIQGLATLLNEVSGIRDYESKKDFLAQEFLKYFGAQEGHYFLIKDGKRLGPNDEIKQGDKFFYLSKN